MGNLTKQDIINLVAEEDVEFIRLQFTDIFGNLKNVAVTSSQLARALTVRRSRDLPAEWNRICICILISIR